MVPTLEKNQKGQKNPPFPPSAPLIEFHISFSLLLSLTSHSHTPPPTERERERERERECGGALGATLKMDTPVKNQLATTSKFEVFPINPTLSILFFFVLLIIIVLLFYFFFWVKWNYSVLLPWNWTREKQNPCLQFHYLIHFTHQNKKNPIPIT